MHPVSNVYNLIKDCGEAYFKDKYFVKEVTAETLPKKKRIKVQTSRKGGEV